eukprot:m.244525 g.244525  ORF g.244525 m.244525 type:complete len:264 (+) comp31490_c0_seq1:129-920(+)
MKMTAGSFQRVVLGLSLGMLLLATSARMVAAAAGKEGTASATKTPSSIPIASVENITEGAERQPLNITEKTPEQALASYMVRFRQKRAQQLEGTEKILEKSDYELRYKLTQALVDEMFRSLRKAQRVLEQTNMSAYPIFPTTNETVLSALVTTWEHTSFLSDLILRLPEILHQQIDDHAVRTQVIAWALTTCLSSPVYASEGLQLPLKLAQQELNLIPRDEDFINPYASADEVNPNDTLLTSLFPPLSPLPRGPHLSARDCWP